MKTDSQLQKEILRGLRGSAKINEASIGVFVRDAIVTLTGQVASPEEKIEAEKCAESIAGVRAVVEQITVQEAEESLKDDHTLARAAVKALENNHQAPQNTIVEVEKGWIRLSGSAENDFEKEVATETVRSLPGARGVSNMMTIKARVKTADVKNKIQEILQKQAIAEAARIKVWANGGKVILSGTVRTFSERSEVEKAAWESPGVTDVKSELRVALFG
jgi:osmotically-inducible protein OsmY